MKASKFTESQIAFVLKQGEEGTAVAEISQRHMARADPKRPENLVLAGPTLGSGSMSPGLSL